ASRDLPGTVCPLDDFAEFRQSAHTTLRRGSTPLCYASLALFRSVLALPCGPLYCGNLTARSGRVPASLGWTLALSALLQRAFVAGFCRPVLWAGALRKRRAGPA